MARRAAAADLILTNQTVTLSGTQTYGVVSLTNSKIIVPAYNGTAGSGNLVIKANTIMIDATSAIVAKGSGYQAALCRDGGSPASFPTAGGQGGCAVFDSGGGGGHIGGGGRGTKDCPGSGCVFPQYYEEDCGDGLASASACASTADCRNNDGLPTVAGTGFQHSPYSIEFGAAGGDKGCRDGDGFTPSSGTSVALAGGNGGGRIVLFAANAGQTGQININGLVNANGNRGCGNGNDSGGGGAGGSILIVGDNVSIGSVAKISAAGGRGGDSQPKCLSCTTNADCGGTGQTCVAGRCGPCNCTPCTSNAQCNSALGQTCKNLGGAFGTVCADASNQCTPVDSTYEENECKGTQLSGTCDDCGGGGGGGLVNVLSRVSSISPLAKFDVRGSGGGICPICQGEAGGSIGELQIDGAYVGEVCDGWDNDFNGLVDDGLPPLNCNGTLMPSCVSGVPQTCPANTPACIGPVTDTRPRFVVIVDTSASMLADIAGNPTFGDGSAGHLGVDTASDPDTIDGNNSKLFLAKAALNNVFAAFPNVDWSLARYHQDSSINRSCQTASWFECQRSCCSYDDPRNNVSPAFPLNPGCNLAGIYSSAGYPAPLSSNINIGWSSQADCINYAGSCGPPRRGADILVGFQRPLKQALSWIDGKETKFDTASAPGDFCNFAGGGDCELRATGPTPIADSLLAVADYLKPVIQCDGAVPCRKYGVILITDGAESCMGNPVTAATALKTIVPGVTVPTYVIGFGVLPSEQAQMNAIASAGGTGTAFFASDTSGLGNALAGIVASSTSYEKCNGLDDNCNGKIDEDFADKGTACDDGKLGVCRGTGVRVCNAAQDGTTCQITTPGATSSAEICNGLDDNCNGIIDEGVCAACAPTTEVCNGVDDDCNGKIDDSPIDVGLVCGSSVGACKPGVTACMSGTLVCSGSVGPTPEVCNGVDDDCDGVVDGMTRSCYEGPPSTEGVGPCLAGAQACNATAGVEAWTACVGQTTPTLESCNGIDDDCNGKIDDVPGAGDSCCPLGSCGKGICVAGLRRCSGGTLQCIGAVGPQAEVCNGLDDDCNGIVDDAPGTGLPCVVTSPVCRLSGLTACDAASGTIICRGLDPTSAIEVCNGIDDDCNGIVDDVDPANDPKIGVACDAPVAPNDHPPCVAGKTICKSGIYVCNAAVKSTPEVCDGKDNDCDGTVDVGATCPAGYDCQSGGCYAPCSTGAIACPGGYVCDSTNHCVPGDCKCDKCEKCSGAKCVDFCSDVTCPPTWKCECGGCVDDSCVTKGCPSGLVCDTSARACVPEAPDAGPVDAGATDASTGEAPADGTGSSGGCGCEVPGRAGETTTGGLALLAIATCVGLRRRGQKNGQKNGRGS